MNERIEKLAVHSLVEYQGELIFSKEKFAELILNQVFMCLENSTTNNKEYNKALSDLEKTLIEHFGVEEVLLK